MLNSEYANKLATAIAELCVSSKEDKDSFIKEVMDSSFLSSISLKGRNNVTYAPLTNHLSTKFYRHIIQIILSIGKRKYTSIVKNYSSIVKCEHGNLDKQCNKKDMQVLKLDCEQHIKEIATEVGEAYATLFTREYNGIFMWDFELDNIELSSYYTKRRMYYMYY